MNCLPANETLWDSFGWQSTRVHKTPRASEREAAKIGKRYNRVCNSFSWHISCFPCTQPVCQFVCRHLFFIRYSVGRFVKVVSCNLPVSFIIATFLYTIFYVRISFYVCFIFSLCLNPTLSPFHTFVHHFIFPVYFLLLFLFFYFFCVSLVMGYLKRWSWASRRYTAKSSIGWFVGDKSGAKTRRLWGLHLLGTQ